MKVIFVGSGEIGLPSLKWLIDSPDIDLCAVVCQPDKPVGRKQALTPPATKSIALDFGIELRQPTRIRNDVEWFQSTAADLSVVMAYGQILPAGVLKAPRLASLNLHASILPRHRGASPIQAAIRDGDLESGITVIYMDEGLDTGDILLTRTLQLPTDETGASLHDRLAELAPEALADAVAMLAHGNAPRTPQDNAAATHCGKLGREDGRIDWARPAPEIERLIRAYHPWPGTASSLAGPNLPTRKLKIFPPVEVASVDQAAEPGEIVHTNNSNWLVATGRNAIAVSQIQPEGKRIMSVSDFLKGHPVPDGSRFFEP
jgi:methionyl-tRNA formyltransferase